MIEPLEIPPRDMAALAAGHGGPSAVAVLRRGRLTQTLLLIRFIVEESGAEHPEVMDAISVMAEVQRRAPDVYRCVLDEPLVGAWAARTARSLGDRRPTDELAVHLGHLGAIAAAAAVRAGVEADLLVASHEGWVTLPGFGRVRASRKRSGRSAGAPLRTAPGAVRTPEGWVDLAQASPVWQPIRRLTSPAAEFPIEIGLDDVDPYRGGGHHAEPEERMSSRDVNAWQEVFTDATRLLATHTPDRATELSAGLRSMVPLVPTSVYAAQSATITDAFGTFGVALPKSGVDLAVALVHEFQHSKLGAINTLVRLHNADDTGYFAPWKTKPRPIDRLFQGVYAFLGVAQTWHALLAEPTVAARAKVELASVRLDVEDALATLRASRALTAAGARFVDRLRQSLDPLLAMSLPRSATAPATESLAARRAAWRASHTGPA